MDNAQLFVKPTNTQIWDCGSSLYDSFELNSFRLQLESAITLRSMSMPHSIHGQLPSQVVVLHAKTTKKSFISKSLRKLVRTVSRLNPIVGFRRQGPKNAKGTHENHYNVAYDTEFGGGVGVIVEAEKDPMNTPEINATVRKTLSERLTSYRTVVAPVAGE